MTRKPKALPGVHEETFSRRLEAWIAALGISQSEAARRCGIEPRAMNNYCTGKRKALDESTIRKICVGLRTHPSYLYGFSDSPMPNDLNKINANPTINR